MMTEFTEHGGVVYRRASIEDVPAIISLFNRAFGRTMDESAYKWQFLENPQRMLLSWVAVHDGEIVAHVGYSPRYSVVNGRQGMMLAKHTSMSDPRHRGKGYYSRLMHYAMEHFGAAGYDLVCSWPNALNHPVQLRHEIYRDICVLPSFTWSPSGIRGSLDLSRLNDMGDELSPVQTFGDDHVALAAASTSGAGYCFRRDLAYLEWRYAQRPDRVYYLLEDRSGGHLRSALVLKIYVEADRAWLNVLEWLSCPDDPEATRCFDALDDLAERYGLAIKLWHNMHDRKRYGLLERRGYRLDAPVMYFGAYPLGDLSRLGPYGDASRWYFSQGDVDVF